MDPFRLMSGLALKWLGLFTAQVLKSVMYTVAPAKRGA